MKEANRRTAEQARETIASILLFDVSNPNLQMITITSCKVSFDRAYCDIFYTVDATRYELAAEALEKSKGHIRSLMAKKLAWKKVPELRFHLDETIDAASRLETFLQAEKGRLNLDSAEEG